MYTSIEIVNRVIDGDTFAVRTLLGEEITRLENVDTKEKGNSGALDAALFLMRLINGEQVEIQRLSEKDQFGRTRAYVWRVRDGSFINLEIVIAGYSNLIPSPNR